MLLEMRTNGNCQQLKATGGPCRATSRSASWLFGRVLGYTGMSVVCWCVNRQKGWVLDGADLDARKKKYILLPDGGKNVKGYCLTPKALGVEDLVRFLDEHMDRP